MKIRIPFAVNALTYTTIALLGTIEQSRVLTAAATDTDTDTATVTTTISNRKRSPSIWPEVTDQRRVSLMTQRDLMYSVPIDGILVLGVNMQRSFISGSEEDIDISVRVDLLETYSELLNQGVAAYTFTIEPDPSKGTWRLVNSTLPFSSVLQKLRDYLEDSSTAVQVNMILLFLNIRVADKSQFSTTKNLTKLLYNELGSRYIYSPRDLDTSLSSEWPTLEEFLFKKKKRVIIFELSNELNEPAIFPSTVLNYELNNVTNLSCPLSSVSQIQNTASKSWRFLDTQFTNDDLPLFSQCGYSPVLANYYNTKNVSEMVILVQNGVIWTWDTATSQPRLTIPGHSQSTNAKKCAVLHYSVSGGKTISWKTEDCYSRRQVLCRSDRVPFLWTVTQDKYTYLESYGTGPKDSNNNKSNVCPDGYHFGLPSTLLELESVLLYLSQVEQQDANPYDRDIWINANSIILDNCWVNGENGASCPYKDTVRRGTLAALLVPATPIAALVLICAFYLSLLTVPIHDNRKNWRRVIKQISKSEMEGVPS